jgi:type I restriction-modification system DNA methylase subunit
MSLYEIQEKDIYELFDKHLMNEKNKDKYGEVFTPRPLIEEILNKIPKSCYSHPHWKWLDPAAGTGHFFLLLFLRLMKGLAKAIPQVQKRKAHILENMFVMVEKTLWSKMPNYKRKFLDPKIRTPFF